MKKHNWRGKLGGMIRGKTRPKENSISGNITITSAGRRIDLASPDFLTRTRITKVLGGHSQNLPYLLMTVPLFFIRSVDNGKVQIDTENDLETLIQLLGEDGVQDVVTAVETHFPAKEV